MRALIVDDDFTNRFLLQSFLAKHGECHVAVNGKEAVAAFRAAQECGKNYDLVWQRKAPANSPKIVLTNGARIIMTTALDDVKNVVEAFKSLCHAYLFKPIDTAKLLGHLREFQLI